MQQVLEPYDTKALSVFEGNTQTKSELGPDDFFHLIEAIVRSGKAIKPGAPKVRVVNVGHYQVPINVTLTASLSPQIKMLWEEKVEYRHMKHWSWTIQESVYYSVHAVITHLGLSWEPVNKRL